MNLFTLVPSPLDSRDFVANFPVTQSQFINLQSLLPAVYNQGPLNSCTAHAVAAVIHKKEAPSRLFIWFNTRSLQKNQLKNVGASMRDAVHSVIKFGVCRESSWPYILDQFDDTPPSQCFLEASQWKIELYARVHQDEKQIEAALQSKFPIIFGMRIFQSFFQTRTTGIVQHPPPNDRFVGGHAMVIVGCDPIRRLFIVRNSWGNTWGNNGHCFIPYDLILDKKTSYDFWLLKDLENNETIAVGSAQTIRLWKSPLDGFSRKTGQGTADLDLTLSSPTSQYILEPSLPEEWPSSWQVLGSNDRIQWTVIDRRINIPPQRQTFPLRTSFTYLRFRPTRSTFKSNYGFGRRISLNYFSIY